MEARESVSAQHCARGDSGSPCGAARASTVSGSLSLSVLTVVSPPEVSEEEEEEESARARPDNPTL